MKGIFALFGCLAATASAHMAITVKTGGAFTFPRAKAKINDAYRNPAQQKTCHGVASGAVTVTVAAGSKLEAKTTFGAGHDGGHCAWFISSDEKTWYKLNDKIDCTKAGQDAPHHVTIPKEVPVACGTKCTLGWFWTPRSSGGCEIYNNCFDIQVTGATGGMETKASGAGQQITTPLTCKRIDQTGATTIYGSLMTSNDGELPSNIYWAGATGGAPNTPAKTEAPVTVLGPTDVEVEASGCTKYTVKSGDTLSAIAARFDIANWKDIQTLNKLENPDSLDIGQILKMPGDCGSVSSGANGAATDSPVTNAPDTDKTGSTAHTTGLCISVLAFAFIL